MPTTWHSRRLRRECRRRRNLQLSNLFHAPPLNNEEVGSGSQQPVYFGIDFGTTNSAVAMVEPGKELRLVRFSFCGEEIPSCRSVLYFEQSKTASGQRRVHGFSGPGAIERYLDAEEKGRLIQSLKSHLSSRSLTGTEVFGRRHRLEELVTRIVSDLRKRAEEQFMQPVRRATWDAPYALSAHSLKRRTNSRRRDCAAPSWQPDLKKWISNWSSWLRLVPTRQHSTAKN